MTVATLAGKVRDITFNSASNDSVNSRWLDTSGRGNHLPFTAGTHAAGTLGSHDAWAPALDSTEYTEFRPCLEQVTLIMAIYHDSTNNPVYYYWEAGLQGSAAYGADDHAGETETSTWTDDDRMYVRATGGTTMIAGSVSGMTTSTITLGNPDWTIVTVVFDPDALKIRIRANDGSWVEDTAASWTELRGQLGHRARLGYWNGTINAQNGYGRFIEIKGDAPTEQSSVYEAAITELIAAYA